MVSSKIFAPKLQQQYEYCCKDENLQQISLGDVAQFTNIVYMSAMRDHLQSRYSK